MDKYEELYKYSKDVFEEELSRFGRVEDKATKFITLVTSLLAVYALVGKQLFGDLFPACDWIRITLVILAGLVLLGLLLSWVYAFKALYIQGVRKAPLDDDMLNFFDNNQLINIYYGMARKYADSLVVNRGITNRKAANIRNSFWCILITVVFFALFVGFAATNQLVLQRICPLVKDNPSISNQKGVDIMRENEDKLDQSEQSSHIPAEQLQHPDKNVVVPDFDVVTESFDPSKLTEKKSKEE